MTLPANIRLNMNVPFPALVQGDGPITLTKANGIWTIGFDIDLVRSLEPISSPTHYGAIGDGSSHPLSERYATLAAAQAVYPHAVSLNDEIDWAALQAMMIAGAFIQLADGGDYYLNRQLSRVGSVRLCGSAIDRSILRWPTTAITAGIAITQVAITDHVRIERMTMICEQSILLAPCDKTAISITNTAGSEPSYCRAVLRDLALLGPIYPSSGWKFGISYTKPFYVVIHNISYSAPVGAAVNLETAITNAATAGILLLSDGLGVTCCVDMEGINVTWANDGIYIEKNIEGVSVRNAQMLNCNSGLFHNGTTDPAQFVVTGGHFNCLLYGVRLKDVYGASVTNNLIFQMSLASSPTNGISLFDCTDSIVTGNQFLKQGAVSFANISVEGNCVGTILSANRHIGGEYAYFLGGGVTIEVSDPSIGVGIGTHFGGDLDGILLSGYERSARVNLNGVNQALAATGVLTKVALTTVAYASGLAFDPATNRITVVTPGTYDVIGRVYFTGGIAAGDGLQAVLEVNGASRAVGTGGAGGIFDEIRTFTSTHRYAVGDYIELFAAKFSGAATTISGNDFLTFLTVTYAGR